ncbi:pentatricopeptide repeat-containing protein At4g14820 [Magnolia sinica]|uniref:pentatricopeptide repeat-containing protein At4g14820 n=1 Tax=Magnolia sinica TaxID=86752 RepID=UPI002659EC31|nr:pentatricopeptide repeat-containing protein At4g14820 [Magnolia sinica]
METVFSNALLPSRLPLPTQTLKPNLLSSFTSITTTTTTSPTLPQLKQLHAYFLRNALDRSLLLKLALSSSVDYALSVFFSSPTLPTHTHTLLSNQFLKQISRCAAPDKAFLVYAHMRTDGVAVEEFSLPPLLKALARVSAFWEGREVHGFAVRMGLESDAFIQTGLVGFYAACGQISDARMVFDRMRHRDAVAWSVMMDGYSNSGLHDDVLRLFEEMMCSEVEEPDEVILATVLSACSRSRNLDSGKVIHSYISKRNFALDSHLQSALITMYANCGSMDQANRLFDKISPKSLVTSTAMVSGYSKLGKLKAARAIFDQMHEKDLVAWSAMIAGYAESDHPNEALKLFKEMQVSGIRPDQVTMLSVISACAHLGALEQAKWIHIFIDKNGFSDILSVSNALIDMYAKCGSLDGACHVFDNMSRRNVISWTSMITALAMHGNGESALGRFEQMKRVEGVEPNGVTFVGVLYACSHAKLVDKGRQIFASMTKEYNITPKQEHYGCMVDLLGRANLLNEAVKLIETMPFEPNVVVWGSLLGACRVYGNIELGELAARRLLEIDPNHDGAYVLLSNIYAKANRWGDVGEVRKLMKNKGITKERGCSWIELNGEIHEFAMGDQTHSRADDIYQKLDEIARELKSVGYAPNIGSVLVDLEEEEKKEAILLHGEKLAVAFGLLNVGKGSHIQIVKNLRICEDCHSFMKWVSKVFDSEIVVRDRTRFHRYRDGECSCKDFW